MDENKFKIKQLYSSEGNFKYEPIYNTPDCFYLMGNLVSNSTEAISDEFESIKLPELNLQMELSLA